MNEIRAVILQPTTLCNLNCEYCYLAHRQKKHYISLSVLKSVRDSLAIQESTRPIAIIWHGGEPLATGIGKFRKMLDVFEELRLQGKIEHHVQTNATLLDTQWCTLIKEYGIRVGVSIDGPAWADQRRVDWAGKEAHDRIIHGINCLKTEGIPFSVISVVGSSSLNQVDEIFDFFYTLGCRQWGINLEELEGINLEAEAMLSGDVRSFWSRLFRLWVEKPQVPIREFQNFFSFAQYGLSHRSDVWVDHLENDWLPTVAWNGDVFLLSPEFAGVKSEQYQDFVAGNILDSTLSSIISLAPKLGYVDDFRKGVMLCKETCRYFAFCTGGQASNKFFENGSISTTQTNFCLNSKQLLFEGIVSVLREDGYKWQKPQ